ncbi:MAG: glycosyltransferase [Pleurocapsa sp. SU_5_0]|nr:glycosyltransferase [Pleurocapsa sp. SU_5_0]NJR46207.1 glycosyltransferase [Hyellaceae cyanobacterium CSU_1_1]
MVVIIVAALPLGIWLFLLLFWGNFWRADCRLDNSQVLSHYPRVCAVVPARNEAEAIATSLTSLLNQDYAGEFSIVLVDDNSSDRTSEIALETAASLGKSDRLKIITGKPLALGWKGKLWAMHQGIESVHQAIYPDYWLFTDADIQHDSNNLTQLVTKAEIEDLDLVSLMVLLRCQSFWEKILIPAFVFFFQKLYPFAWVNNPHKSMAAAAGGCILISNQALTSIGGIARIKDALIDDCTLAQAVKSSGKNIWLGLSETTISLRGYDNLKVIWDTIARTAYTQLNYSPLLLIGTVIGMIIVYLIAPIGTIWGLITRNWLVFSTCAVTWLLMIWAYLPTIKLYKIAWTWAGLLPAIAFLYLLMTIDSAVKYYQGQGGAWKGRTYD